MKIKYTWQGQKKEIPIHSVARLNGAELQQAILAASLLGLDRLLPTYLIFKGNTKR
jgi:hypothetical protein